MSSPAPTPDLHTGFSAPGARPTPWEDVVGVLVSAELFWISTVRNLCANDQCVLTTGDNRWKAGLDVVVEGRAEQVTDDALLRALAALWETKYDGDWKYDVREGAFHVAECRRDHRDTGISS